MDATAGFTVTVFVADAVQPKPLVTVAVYVNAVVVTTVVGCTYTVVTVLPVYGVVKAASRKRFVVGDHVAAAEDVSVALPPLQIVTVVVGVITGVAGTGLRLTTVDAVMVQVPLVADNT